MSLVKYRLKEVATDFGKTPKDIAEIVAKFTERPKSNTQVLTDDELNAVFDYITATNQISSLEEVFAAQPKKVEEKKVEEKKPAPQQTAPQKSQNTQQAAPQKPAAPQQPQKPAKQPPKSL